MDAFEGVREEGKEDNEVVLSGPPLMAWVVPFVGGREGRMVAIGFSDQSFTTRAAIFVAGGMIPAHGERTIHTIRLRWQISTYREIRCFVIHRVKEGIKPRHR